MAMRMLASENVHGEYTSPGMGGSSHFLRALACLAAVAALSTSCSLLPDLEEEERKAKPLAQTSKIYDSRGRLITTLHAEEDRIVIPIERIPEPLQRAVVAVEDKRFWTHRGIDLRAVLRAAYVNATSGQVVEGGSTITQQYVRNAFSSVGTEQTIGRKLKEAALAWQLEKQYSKDEILGRYLNTVYFGQGAYGIQQAARTFFSKPAWELRLAESALLAGLIAGPERYDPLDTPSIARLRRDEVLEKMLEQGMISPDRYQRVVERPLGLQPAPDRQQYAAAYFVDYVKRQILTNERFGETDTQRYNFLFKGGLRSRSPWWPPWRTASCRRRRTRRHQRSSSTSRRAGAPPTPGTWRTTRAPATEDPCPSSRA
jgi:membrane peptidoglycan carboxypeptidase